MTESEIIKFQTDQIDRLISMNNWTVSTFITIIFAVVGFIGFLQWRLSDKQIQSIKIDLEKSISEKYKLEDVKLLEGEAERQQKMLDKLILDVISITNGSIISSHKHNLAEEIQLHMILASFSILNIYEDMAPDKLIMKITNDIYIVLNGPTTKLDAEVLNHLNLLVDSLERKSSEEMKTKDDYINLKNLSTKKAAIF
jgi:hypothetical protein